VEIDRAGLEVLSVDECLRLLAASEWGRVAITVGALPAILPVRFVLAQDEILFRAGQDTALSAATRGAVVAFQADGDRDGAHWSVLATGLARHLDDGPAPRDDLALPGWSTDGGDHLVAIAPEVITGRRVVPSGPAI
jgi:nitroimidazol reductase NimA-like FMN-containing flavoprotein (pyridoxamine 5'-phosphate oxidase superfamily)